MKKVIVVGFVLFAGITLIQQVQLGHLSDEIRPMLTLAERVEDASEQAMEEIEATEQRVRQHVGQEFRDSLTAAGQSISQRIVQRLRAQLDSVRTQVEAEELRLEEIRDQNRRAEAGLPELIDLDELNQYYYEKQETAGSGYLTFESFDTERGTISFGRSDFSFTYVPSTRQLARLRIGKQKSTLNSELIRAWLDESAQAKQRQGYQLIYDRTRPADYGSYTERLYRKGDMYFTTYHQSERVQGTYDRFSLQYTFYVEIGSETRVDQYQIEQYNQKLGS